MTKAKTPTAEGLTDKQRQQIKKDGEAALSRCRVERVINSKNCIVRPASPEDAAAMILAFHCLP